nr:MAG TPA: RNA polymerase sigma-H factor [Caudoviricetes sp.]
MYNLSSAEGKFLRTSLAREFFIEYEDVLTDLATKYFEHYVEEKSIKELAEMLNTPYHTIVYQYHNQKWTDIKILNMLAHNMQALLMLPPELIVSEEVAGDELLEIQRYLYKYLRETFD